MLQPWLLDLVYHLRIWGGGDGNLNKRGLNIFLPMKRGRLSQEGLKREFLIIAVTTNLISSAIVTNHLEVPYLVFNLTKYI